MEKSYTSSLLLGGWAWSSAPGHSQGPSLFHLLKGCQAVLQTFSVPPYSPPSSSCYLWYSGLSLEKYWGRQSLLLVLLILLSSPFSSLSPLYCQKFGTFINSCWPFTVELSLINSGILRSEDILIFGYWSDTETEKGLAPIHWFTSQMPIPAGVEFKLNLGAGSGNSIQGSHVGVRNPVTQLIEK